MQTALKVLFSSFRSGIPPRSVGLDTTVLCVDGAGEKKIRSNFLVLFPFCNNFISSLMNRGHVDCIDIWGCVGF